MAVTYKRLGRHGTLVSNLCSGTVNIGSLISEKKSFALLDRALEHGINFFDTADIYGFEWRLTAPLSRHSPCIGKRHFCGETQPDGFWGFPGSCCPREIQALSKE